MLGCSVPADPLAGLSAAEVAATALRALAIPAIAHLRSQLVPEYSVSSSTSSGLQEDVRKGFVDAIAIDAGGAAQAVIDWKSDVEPDGAALEHYKAQVRAYLGMTGVRRGLVVFATTGAAHEVVAEG
jgi:exodeoxyribonuclease-5